MNSEMLEGTVRKEDALEIKNMLQQQTAEGNRFVVFPSGADGLTKNDFAAFKSAFDAQEHAYENTTDYDKYIVRSIPVIEKEMTNMLENKKEQLQDHPNDEREDKRSRDQELSR